MSISSSSRSRSLSTHVAVQPPAEARQDRSAKEFHEGIPRMLTSRGRQAGAEVMVQTWVWAGVAFAVAGVLEVTLLALWLAGTPVGTGMTGAAPFGDPPGVAAFIGPFLMPFYGLWLFSAIVAGPVHVAAGVALVTGRRNRSLLIGAIAASILTLGSYYVPVALTAAVLGLLTLRAPAFEPTAPVA